jgi:hypothetical protein
MGAAYSSPEWHDLFVATAGASAALTGLVFVAVSVNIERILKFAGLPDRALQTLGLLLGALVLSIVGLIPAQSNTALGIELLIVACALTIGVAETLRRTVPGGRAYQPISLHMLIVLPATLPALIGAVSVLAAAGGGLYWIVGAIVGGILGASVNAWVLLVEILR